MMSTTTMQRSAPRLPRPLTRQFWTLQAFTRIMELSREARAAINARLWAQAAGNGFVQVLALQVATAGDRFHLASSCDMVRLARTCFHLRAVITARIVNLLQRWFMQTYGMSPSDKDLLNMAWVPPAARGW